MLKSLPKVFIILGIPLLAVFFLMSGLGGSAAQGMPGVITQGAVTESISTTLNAPVITPTNTGMCSGWFSYTNELGQEAYLALNYNLDDPLAKLNSGTWRPNLPKDGVYRVEALVPAHPAIGWDCPPDLKIAVEGDTSAARYVVNSQDGEDLVVKDQSAASGWLPLGNFVFAAGSDGYVRLTNLTNEESMTHTVSFSAMRFTWLRPPPNYLPLVLKNSGFTVNLVNTWSSDPQGNAKYAFLPGEGVVYHSSGTNQIGQAAKVQVLWTRTSDKCGSTMIFSGTVSLKMGDWELSQAATLPDCTGIYTQTFQMTYLVTDYALQSQFVTNNLSWIMLSDRPAFDRCYAPTVEQMRAWKEKSPYDDFNLYIGGISFGCKDAPLDPFWIHQVSDQGWSFILTWVGLQAPCSSFKYRMSYDPVIAYVQGRQEAEAAAAAADRLGLIGQKVIYYDLESYSSSASTTCREAVKWFVKGWVERLHDFGYKAGFYGAPCTSYMSDWALVDPPPDDVWIAYWTEKTYSETVSVFDVPCGVKDEYWPNNQRLRQYTGGHKETYGGVSLVIDSNIADGEITSMQKVSAAMLSSASGQVKLVRTTPQIQDVQLLPDGQGWALLDGRLLWSADGGLDWQDRTPKAFEAGQVLAGYFQDASHGWFALRDLNRSQINILRTQDGGKSWQQEAIGASNGNLSQMAANASFDFIDAQTGWLAFKLQSSSSFSLGELYGTSDGGATWKHLELPIGEAVHFSDARRGWTAGGVSGSELYRTEDGGQTWQAQKVLSPEMNVPGRTFISAPVFQNERDGTLVVTYGSQVLIYTTHDSGESWQQADNLALSAQVEPGSPPAVSEDGRGNMVLAAPGQSGLISFSSNATTVERLNAPSLPAGVVKLSFVNGDLGWAQVQNGNCDSPANSRGKECRLDSYLMMTRDGGRTWSNVSPK